MSSGKIGTGSYKHSVYSVCGVVYSLDSVYMLCV